MRKQPRVLEHIADAPAVRRDVMRAAVSSSVSPSSAMMPRSGRSRPAIMLISEVLPAPEAPNSPVTRPSLVKEAASENSPSCFVDVDAQHGQFPCRRCVARRANHSEAIRAPIAITMEMSTSRPAAASPSGVWISE